MVKLARSVRYSENGDLRLVTLSVPFQSFRPTVPVTRCCETLKKPSSASRCGGEPHAVINQFGVAQRQRLLEMRGLAIDGQAFRVRDAR